MSPMGAPGPRGDRTTWGTKGGLSQREESWARLEQKNEWAMGGWVGGFAPESETPVQRESWIRNKRQYKVLRKKVLSEATGGFPPVISSLLRPGVTEADGPVAGPPGEEGMWWSQSFLTSRLLKTKAGVECECVCCYGSAWPYNPELSVP